MHPGGLRANSGEPARPTLAATETPRTLVAIPARWGASRFPGKPLHVIAGKPLVQHVWERCQACREVDDVVIATDDARIAEAATGFGARAVLTSPDHPSGTDRVAEAARAFAGHGIVINVQGDEPLISPALIDRLAATLRAAAPIHEASQVADPNVVKVVFDHRGDSLYFSRSPLPFVRDATAGAIHHRHLGVYGFRRDFLLEFVAWPPSLLERTECLEQLRALEAGMRIDAEIVDTVPLGVDTPADLEKARAIHTRPGVTMSM